MFKIILILIIIFFIYNIKKRKEYITFDIEKYVLFHTNKKDIDYVVDIGSEFLDDKIDPIPKGIIIPFTGTIIPDGWVICNGSNGTPDLKDRFILGSNDDHPTGTKYSNGKIGPILDSSNMPSHKHNGSASGYPTMRGTYHGIHIITDSNAGTGDYNQTADGADRHNKQTTNTGSDSWNPPYYTLIFLMKI